MIRAAAKFTKNREVGLSRSPETSSNFFFLLFFFQLYSNKRVKESKVKKNLTQQSSSPNNATGFKPADAHATKNQMSVDKSKSSSRKAKEDAASVAISLEKGERRARGRVGDGGWKGAVVGWPGPLANRSGF